MFLLTSTSDSGARIMLAFVERIKPMEMALPGHCMTVLQWAQDGLTHDVISTRAILLPIVVLRNPHPGRRIPSSVTISSVATECLLHQHCSCSRHDRHKCELSRDVVEKLRKL